MGQPVTHWQILARNPDTLSAFYATLFAWKITADNQLGYRMAEAGSERGIPGGFWPAGPEGHAFVQLFIEVDDVTQYVERVKELGGSVIIPPQALPEGGMLAIVRDPEGLPFGLTKAGARL